MAIFKTIERLTLISVVLLTLGGVAAPAYAIPVRRTTTSLPPAAAGAESCRASVKRFTSGPGRRPGATVVPVTLRLQVLHTNGQFVEASADRTRATVSGNDVTLKAIVSNRSLYDVGNVVIDHSFLPSTYGPRMESIGSVSGGAILNERLGSFVIDRVPSDDVVTFTFHLFLSGDINGGLSQSQIRLEDFEVLESERRLPERTPETPAGRSTQTVERIGIGGTDVACFTGDGVVRYLPSSEPQPVTTSTRSSTSGRGTTTTPSSGRREPGPPYLVPTGGTSSVSPTTTATPVQTTAVSASVSLQKRASATEVQPGGSVTYTITVENTGTQPLQNIVVDDRFDTGQLRVPDAQGGSYVPSGIQWTIPTLGAGATWVVRYRAQVLSDVAPGESIQSTTILTGVDLLDTPTTQRSTSLSITSIAWLPQTGVNILGVVRSIQTLGALGIIASLLYVFVLRRVKTKNIS